MTRPRFAALLAACLAACGGGDFDPCRDTTRNTCLAVTATSNTDLEIDTLEIDILQGEFHRSMSTMGTATLPVATAIYDIPVSTEPLVISAAGKRGGAIVGVGWARTTSAQIEVELAPAPAECAAGALYCGTSADGDIGVLYRCDDGRVPIARGRCLQSCEARDGADDTCTSTEACVTGTYCGGNKVEGDPQSLFTCTGGVPRFTMVCPTRCLIRPGDDDRCE